MVQQAFAHIEDVTSSVKIAGSAFGLCAGDSGGGAIANVRSPGGLPPILRVVGVASSGTERGCTVQPGYFIDATTFVSWMESESRLKLTPCFNDRLEWDPSPDCVEWALGDSNNLCGATRRFASSCGLPASAPEPTAPPAVWFVHPAVGERYVMATYAGGAAIPVVIGATSPAGVREVTVAVFDGTGTRVAGDTSQWEPYRFPTATLEAGAWRIRAEAEDFLGQVSSDEIAISIVSRVDTTDHEPPRWALVLSACILLLVGACMTWRNRRAGGKLLERRDADGQSDGRR